MIGVYGVGVVMAVAVMVIVVVTVVVVVGEGYSTIQIKQYQWSTVYHPDLTFGMAHI